MMLIRVRCHSRVSMTMRTATAWMMLVMMPTRVLEMAFCAPTTSLFRRLISSPTLVLVKKRSDMRWRRAEEGHAQIIDDALADIGIQAALEDVDKAAQGRDEQEGQRQPDQAV